MESCFPLRGVCMWLQEAFAAPCTSLCRLLHSSSPVHCTHDLDGISQDLLMPLVGYSRCQALFTGYSLSKLLLEYHSLREVSHALQTWLASPALTLYLQLCEVLGMHHSSVLFPSCYCKCLTLPYNYGSLLGLGIVSATFTLYMEPLKGHCIQ